MRGDRKVRDTDRASEAAEPSDCWGCATHKAVTQFSAAYHAALARKVVFKLQRMPAAGAYGDDYRHKTMWDEYCHEIQNGPHGPLEHAWNDTIIVLIDHVVESVPHAEAALLTIGAIWDLGEDDAVPDGKPAIVPDLIRRNVERILVDLASARDMSRFDLQYAQAGAAPALGGVQPYNSYLVSHRRGSVHRGDDG